MRLSSRTARRLLPAVLVLAAGAAIPPVPASAAGYDCAAGRFCMYDGWNGGGDRCQYTASTSNTADACSFIRRGRHVLSVWNGTGRTATYYTQTNHHARVGSTKSGHGGNLMGTYQIRSITF